MALKANVKSRGVTIKDAYIRVEPHTLNKEMLGFRMIALASEDAVEPFAVEDRVCPYHLDGPNPWVQAYEYLKGLPEFAKADDLLAKEKRPELPAREDNGPKAGPAVARVDHPDRVR